LKNKENHHENKLAWPVTFLIWGAGFFVIYLLWGARVFVNDFAESIFGFALYIVAFFYFLAIGPIKGWVDGFLE